MNKPNFGSHNVILSAAKTDDGVAVVKLERSMFQDLPLFTATVNA